MNETRLYELLRLKREHDTMGERLAVERVLNPYMMTPYVDSKGETLAYCLQIALPDGSDARTLFSAHVDTVHFINLPVGVDPEFKDFVNSFWLDAIHNIVYADGDVLGADDGAGVWLLLEMIDAGIPGTYLFHRGEECGGIGSSGMARHHAGFLGQFDRAIAFDRKATHSIITHQRGGRCCSDAFAEALARHLSCGEYFMAPDDGGTFTDTANYTDDIAECTNVSVGYSNEHTIDEKLDLNYLFALRDKCLVLDWESLPTVRKPGEVDKLYRPLFGKFKPHDLIADDEDDASVYTGTTLDDLANLDFDDLLDMCETDPYTAANLMYQLLWSTQNDDRVLFEQGDHYDRGDHGRFVLSFDENDDDRDIWDVDSPHLQVGMR